MLVIRATVLFDLDTIGPAASTMRSMFYVFNRSIFDKRIQSKQHPSLFLFLVFKVILLDRCRLDLGADMYCPCLRWSLLKISFCAFFAVFLIQNIKIFHANYNFWHLGHIITR